MTRLTLILTLASGLLVCRALVANDPPARPNAEFAKQASWKAPTAAEVREQVTAYLEQAKLDDAVRAQALAPWENADPAAQPLELLLDTLAAVDPQAQGLIEVCARPRDKIALPETVWLMDQNTPALVRANLRLVYGRWLVEEALFDEAQTQLEGLKPEEVVDPAALLFYQSVVSHRLLARDAAVATLTRLMENEAALPRRYVSLARLMQADLEGLKDDSLDHIARRMDDIRRRLDLGRAGPKVRSVEDGVIASLDKMIEEMEKQQQAAAAAAAAAQQKSGGQPQQMPSNPLPDSMPMQLKGEGKVANKPVGDSSGWGNLPPRERDEALQQIGKEFPAHYRDMIEQYFRKLAADSEDTPDK